MNLEQPLQPRIAHKDNPFMNKNFEHNIFAQKKTPEQKSAQDTTQEIFQSAEQKILVFEDTTQKQILDIEKQIELPEADLAEVRDEIGVIERLKEIGAKAQALLGSLKEKVSRYFSADKKIDTSIHDAAQENQHSKYQSFKEYLRFEKKEISGPLIEEAKKKRNEILEDRGLFSMSKVDFDEYFSSQTFEVRADMEQQNVGDCYIIAAIHAMSRSPHFEMLCRSSMKKLSDGSWEVTFPFLDKNGKTIIITAEELLPQKNRQFLKRSEDGGILPDFRRTLLPVKGKEGLQVLEAACIKQKFGTVDRLSAEAGQGDEVLMSLGGENFKEFFITSTQANQGLEGVEEQKMALLDHFLENFDTEIYMATVATKDKVAKQLSPKHAYSISSVDVANKTVNLADPWDTSKTILLTFEEFKKQFNALKAVRVDSFKLLTNMKNMQVKENI